MIDHDTATGHVRVEERAKGRRVWVAEYQVGDGTRTRKTLGPAWVRPSGKTTARGAVLWRAGHGSKPDASYLTPAEAEAKLAALIDDAKQKRTRAPRAARGKTFGEAIKRWLDHVEHEAGVDPGTLRGYRVIAGKLKEEFPADTPLRQFTQQRIEDYQSALLRTPVSRGKKTACPPRPRSLHVAIADHGLGNVIGKVSEAAGPDDEQHALRDGLGERQFLEQRVVRLRVAPDVVQSVDEHDLGPPGAARSLTELSKFVVESAIQRVEARAARRRHLLTAAPADLQEQVVQVRACLAAQAAAVLRDVGVVARGETVVSTQEAREQRRLPSTGTARQHHVALVVAVQRRAQCAGRRSDRFVWTGGWKHVVQPRLPACLPIVTEMPY